MNGTTSVAPMRGCSPVCFVRSIRSVATRMPPSAASRAASGGATNVNTERLCDASACTSSSRTPGTLVSAARRASMVAALRPSEKLGTHSMRGEGIETSNAECGIRNAESLDACRARRSPFYAALRIPHSAFSRAPQHVHEPLVHHRITGDDRAVSQHVVRAVQCGHAAAGFPDEHHAGRYVPGCQGQLPETVEAACRHVREIDGGAAGPADTPRRAHHRGELVQLTAQLRKTLVREPGADERVARLREVRHSQPVINLPGAEPRRPPGRALTGDVL